MKQKTGTLYPQLWVSIVEKGYAKLHGSYFSISGGFVEEAMLDLTGAPVHTIDFTHSLFNMQVFWRQLQHYRRMQFPMGCGTLFVFSSRNTHILIFFVVVAQLARSYAFS